MDGDVLVGVLLAAGAGRRLGRGPKALLRLAGGQPQVARVAHGLRVGGCDEVIVVAGAGAGRVRGALASESCRVVVNDDWDTGLGSSFRAGVEAASRLIDARSGGFLVIALVDQPDVDGRVVAALRRRAAPDRVTAAGYADACGRLVRGHPLIFPAALAREAAGGAAGDAGARAWLRAHPERVELVDVSHLATGRDVDTPADLAHWLSTTGGAHDAAR